MARNHLDFDRSYPSDYPYHRIAPGFDSAEGLRGANHLTALLHALDRAGTKLESFSLGFMDWRIFEDPDTIDWDLASRVIESLKTVRIRLFLLCNGRNERLNAISCRELFRQGQPLRLLESMPSLINLEIYVKPTYVASWLHDDIDLRSLFGTHTWPALRRFAVHGFLTTQQDLKGFFERHSGSLKVVELSGGEIHEGRWGKVFKMMGRILKLDDCKFRGLRDPNGDEADQWESADNEEHARVIYFMMMDITSKSAKEPN